MHILMVTASLPYPPHQGGAIRGYGILYGLYEAGYQITLLSFQDATITLDPATTPLAQYCQRIVTVPSPQRSTASRLKDLLLSTQADIAGRQHSAAMQQQLQQLLQETNFDLIQFEGIEVAGYLLQAKAIQPQTPMIYDAFNAEAALQRVIAQVDRGDFSRLLSGIYSTIQAGRIERFERSICNAADGVIAVSPEDAAVLEQFRLDRTVHVVPNGIFTDQYLSDRDQLDLKPNALVFTGKMDYRPNVDAMLWFTNNVLPKLQQKVDVHLYIVGQKPHPRLDALRVKPNIHVTGWVPEVQPYLYAADVYIAPLRMGSGTRLKILEAMAAGCAVVATPTAASGLMQSASAHMIVATDEHQLAAAISDLLQDPQKRTGLGKIARDYIQNHYNWPVLIPRLLDAYKDILH